MRMIRTPAQPGLPEREQHKAGRAELLATPFETFEKNIRDQLGRMLGPGGFDPARDIAGIAVNRWPHGYAPEYNALCDSGFDADHTPNHRAPQEASAASPSPIPIPAWPPIPTSPSTRPIAR